MFVVCVVYVCMFVANKIGAKGGRAVGEGMRHCPQLQTINLRGKRGVERGRERGRDGRENGREGMGGERKRGGCVDREGKRKT